MTTFEYNARNLPIRRIDHGGRTGTPGAYSYDAAKTETYAYDAAGRMTTRIDRMGTETVWTYDARGHVLTEIVGNDAVGRTWDGNGNLLTLTDATGTTTSTYDAMNRLLTKQDPLVGTLSYVYDRITSLPAGHVGERMTDAAGHITDTVYDRMGRISQVVSGTDSATYTYTDTGLRESLVYGSGVREDYTYTVDGLLESLINRKGDGTVIDSYAYTYDAAHNQTAKTDGKGTTAYTYDNLNRLLTVSETNGRTTAYTFDAAGNRLTETVTHGSTTTAKTSTLNEHNRLTRLETRVNGTLTETRLYDWDAAGNLLTTTTNGTLVQENAYDVRNQLTTTTSGGIRLDSAYNGEGLRVSKRTGGPNGPVERFQLDGDRVVLETDGSGNTLAVNVYGTNLLFRTSGSDTYAYLYNGHADVTALVQLDGQVAGTWYYDAFGVPTDHTGVESPYTYAGYRYDGETGLYYLNARMYDPELARFLQEDTYRGEPNDPLSLNLYAYCHNNPVTYDDPSGHFLHIVAGALLGAAFDAAMDIGSQMLFEKKSFNELDWRSVAISAGEGAITGGIGAATGGASLAASAGAKVATAAGRQIVKTAARTALTEGTIAMGASAVSQYMVNGRVDWQQTAMTGVTSALTGGAGSAIPSTKAGKALDKLGKKVEGQVRILVDAMDNARMPKAVTSTGHSTQFLPVAMDVPRTGSVELNDVQKNYRKIVNQADSVSIPVSGNGAGASEVSAAERPVFEVSREQYPNHTKMLDNAQEYGHSLEGLERGGGTREAQRNRYNAQKEIRKQQGQPPEGFDYDEFPYASTKQGGSGAYVEPVPSAENQAVGRDLGQFYRKYGLKENDKYDVKIKR